MKMNKLSKTILSTVEYSTYPQFPDTKIKKILMTKILFKEKNIFAVLKARKNTSKMLTWIKYWIINWRESKFFNKMSKKV